MADIKIDRDSKLIKLFAAQVRNERVDSDKAEEANQIISELVTDFNRDKADMIAQTVAFTVNELQKGALDFLGNVADVKNINAGDKAAFKTRLGGIKAYLQAKGATTARSYVADKQILVDTQEIAARPAINIIDLRAGRVNMADLIREANQAITNKKLLKIEQVLHGAIDDFSSPFYGTGTGVVQATLDAQLNYFRRLGPVNILGDNSAVAQLAPFTGMAINATPTWQYSGNLIDEHNNNGFIGRYNGCNVIAMDNAYEAGATTPILATDWLYIIPGNMSPDMRNLKVVNEGGVETMNAQNIDDRTFEVLLYQWFGAAFVVGHNPTIGAYKIGS